MGNRVHGGPWTHQASAVQPAETDDDMRAFAEQVFASETKDESVRDEFSMFGVAEDCPIFQKEMADHVHTDDNAEKRWDKWMESWLYFTEWKIRLFGASKFPYCLKINPSNVVWTLKKTEKSLFYLFYLLHILESVYENRLFQKPSLCDVTIGADADSDHPLAGRGLNNPLPSSWRSNKKKKKSILAVVPSST